MDAYELERRITALETRNAVDDVHRSNVGNRLAAIEEALRWLVASSSAAWFWRGSHMRCRVDLWSSPAAKCAARSRNNAKAAYVVYRLLALACTNVE